MTIHCQPLSDRSSDPVRLGELVQPFRLTHLASHHGMPCCGDPDPRGRVVGHELTFFSDPNPCPQCLKALGLLPQPP